MKKYSREMIAQVLAANDIVDVIGGIIDLKPAGGNRYKALSPFTNEKTPSFMVSRDRQMYHCFSSGQGGDTIRFLMEYEGLGFNEALQKLADRAGIKIETAGPEEDKEAWQRKRILELNEFAAKFYRRCLLNGAEGVIGRKYLEKRGLHESTETRFGLGLAVDDWSRLYDAAIKQQFRESELVASGMVRRGDRAFYDFFRNRLIVPIRDVSGNVVAFGGRDLGDSPAKYINSPETPAYKKSRVLYGLLEARDAMRREQCVLLVEGYFDLMRCFDAGIENVVATCGTALTEQQAMLIKRYVPEVVVVYDGDAAGIRAALKGIGILSAAGLTVRAMSPPDGKDPDDYIRDAGAEVFRAHIAKAPDFVSFYLDMSRERLHTIEGKTEIAHELFAIIRTLDQPIRAEQYLAQIAEGLGVHIWDCKRDFERFYKSDARRPSVELRNAPEKEETFFFKDDIDFIAALLAFPELRQECATKLGEIESEDITFALAARICAENAPPIVHDLDDLREQALYSAAVTTEAMEYSKARELVHQRAGRFLLDRYEKEMKWLQEQMRQANKDKDAARSASLFDRIMTIKFQMEALSAS